MATAKKAASKTTATKAAPKAAPAPAPAPAAASAPASSGSDEKTLAIVAHVLMIVTFWLGPLILYLVRRSQPGFALDAAREALNFGITLTIASIVAYILAFVTLGMLMFLPGLVWLVGLVFGILACVAVNKGEPYRYPFALRLVK